MSTGRFGARGRPIRPPSPRGVERARPGDVQPASPGATTRRESVPDLGPPQPIVTFRHVFKIYRIADTGVVALAGVDLQIARAEFIAVVGPSGSGKSTVLNLIGGLDAPSAGTVEVNGRDLGQLTEQELTRYRREAVGFVWQGTARNLVPYLSLRDNVGLPLTATGQSGSIRHRAMELLEVVGLADRARHRPEQLSGGEQQRAAIAVALANLPPLLLADEPTAELDSVSADRVLTAFRDVNREFGATIVMVTHDLVAAAKSGRMFRLRDGRLVHEGHTLDRVGEDGRLKLPHPAVRALFGSDLEAEVSDGEVRLRKKVERRRRGDPTGFRRPSGESTDG